VDEIRNAYRVFDTWDGKGMLGRGCLEDLGIEGIILYYTKERGVKV